MENITINNPALYSVLDEFEKNTKRFSNDDVKFISISVDPTEKDTLYGFYNSKLLKLEFYIGVAKWEKINIYFYSDAVVSPNSIFEINQTGIKSPSEILDFSDVYTEYYHYHNNVFSLSQLNER